MYVTRLIGILGVAVLGAAVVPAAQAQTPAATTLICVSNAGERQVCPGDTSSGVVLVKATGAAACLLGKTWGYDEKGVWVTDGCSGEFVLGPTAVAVETQPTVPAASAVKPAERIEEWGDFAPGNGFLVGRGSAGELSISGYALLRYINQMPGTQTYTDHLGNERNTDGRNDFYPHRVMVFLKGWLADPKLVYSITLWTVLATDQNAIFGNIGYQFHRRFSLYGGLNGNPGTRSLQGSHPYWLGHDRVMADEFFRPFFGSGVWAQGTLTEGFWYNVVTTNNNSSLGRQDEPAGSHLLERRLGVVDADDEGVRAARRLWRLGVARGAGDAVRRLVHVQPGAAFHQRHDLCFGKHDHQAGRQRERVRYRRARGRCHRRSAGVPAVCQSTPA